MSYSESSNPFIYMDQSAFVGNQRETVPLANYEDVGGLFPDENEKYFFENLDFIRDPSFQGIWDEYGNAILTFGSMDPNLGRRNDALKDVKDSLEYRSKKSGKKPLQPESLFTKDHNNKTLLAYYINPMGGYYRKSFEDYYADLVFFLEYLKDTVMKSDHRIEDERKRKLYINQFIPGQQEIPLVDTAWCLRSPQVSPAEQSRFIDLMVDHGCVVGVCEIPAKTKMKKLQHAQERMAYGTSMANDDNSLLSVLPQEVLARIGELTLEEQAEQRRNRGLMNGGRRRSTRRTRRSTRTKKSTRTRRTRRSTRRKQSTRRTRKFTRRKQSTRRRSNRRRS